MIALADVQAHVLSTVTTLLPVTIATTDALGLVTAEPVTARESVPPFANSAMDGYAVRAADLAGASAVRPVRLTVVDELPAGRAPSVAVGPGEAIRIMTGAPVPDGADAVAIVEVTERDGDGVLVLAPATPGDHVRGVGGDIAPGDIVVTAGTVLSAAHLGVLASIGADRVAVHPRARVGVLSTGDELVPPGQALAPGKIRDSNRPMLLALARQAGCDVVDLGIARDDEAVIEGAFTRGLAECDALLTSGGVSVGDYDFVKVVLDRLGEMQWFQVAIRPAKPFAFGVAKGVPVFGLPGNPVSSHVSFELFARPALLTMMGHPRPRRPIVAAVAGEAMARRPDGKLHLDRVRVHDDGGRLVAARAGGQASNVLTAMANANGLALLPDGGGVMAGDPVDVMLLDWPAGK
jgi:molybdenum cofactor synthesis domain-containing protein